MLTSPHISLSFAPIPSLSLSSSPPALAPCIFLESPVGNVNRDFTAQCRCISRAHISPTCDLHQRRGSWGIFHANEREWSGDGGWVRGWGGCGGDGASTLGLDAVRHSNNGGVDHPAERCFYCKENLHDCIQVLLRKCQHPPDTAYVWLTYLQHSLEQDYMPV